MAKCPICDAAVRPRANNPAFPFCSTRCKMVDLGKWLNEEYRVPIAEEDSEIPDEGEDSDHDHPAAASGSKTEKDVRH